MPRQRSTPRAGSLSSPPQPSRPIQINIVNHVKEPPPHRYGKILTASILLLAMLVAGNFFWNRQQPAAPKVIEANKDRKSEEKAAAGKPARHKSPASDLARTSLPPVGPEGRVMQVSEHGKPPAPINCPANIDRLGCNGRVGVFDAPQCPAHFHVDGESCAPD